ncbi:MAG: Wzz/FepE/Etk N-terminal domain-containing protein [bacterium]|nr:Wzz/FepE/Etk N-terminal domain-containing protein [bacterium]
MDNPEYENEEINIKEIIDVIFKRKKMFLGIMFFIVICTVAVSFFIPKTYEVQAVIQRGTINAPILSYPETVTILKSSFFTKPIFKKLNVDILEEENIVKQINIDNIKDTNYFIVTIRLKDKELSYLLIQEIINSYIEYGAVLYNIQFNSIKNNISQFENLIERTNLEIDSELSNKKGNNLNVIFPNNKVQLKDLLTQKFQLENQLLFAKEFKLINEPVKPKKPVSPKKLSMVIVSFFIAFVISLFCVFLSESLEKTKSKS